MGKYKIIIEMYSEIAEKYINGKTTIELGKEYGTSDATIRNILIRSKVQLRSRGYKKSSDGITQVCTMCKTEYPFTSEYFHKRTKNLDINKNEILQNYCIECNRKRSLEYRNANKEILKQKQKENHQKYLPKIIAYRQSHKKERSKYISDRIKNDHNFRVRRYLSRRLNSALKFQGLKKTSKTMELLGCSISDFRKYLEKQFSEGMTWDNHGFNGWHIDHIKPCASFDLTIPEEQQKCFHYSNMQPLWAQDNLSKSSYFNGVYHSINPTNPA